MNDMSRHGNNRLAVLAAEIVRADLLFRRATEEAAQAAIDAGNALIEAKSLLKHGEWLPWLAANVPMSQRSVSRYMRIARSGMKSDTVANLGIRATDEALAKHLPELASDDDDAAPAEPYDFGIPINDVRFVRECYPRTEGLDLEYVRQLSLVVGDLPPIEVNQHNELIDGRHRWEAHKARGMRRIRVIVTQTDSVVDHLMIACQRNSRHGLRHNERDLEHAQLIVSQLEAGDEIAERLAKEFGISPSEVLRCGLYANAVETIAGAFGDAARSEILSARRKMTRDEIHWLAEEIRAGRIARTP